MSADEQYFVRWTVEGGTQRWLDGCCEVIHKKPEVGFTSMESLIRFLVKTPHSAPVEGGNYEIFLGDQFIRSIYREDLVMMRRFAGDEVLQGEIVLPEKSTRTLYAMTWTEGGHRMFLGNANGEVTDDIGKAFSPAWGGGCFSSSHEACYAYDARLLTDRSLRRARADVISCTMTVEYAVETPGITGVSV